MLFKTRKPAPAPAVDENEIIKNFLEKIALAYKDQPISAERMIEMELDLIAKRRYGHRFEQVWQETHK